MCYILQNDKAFTTWTCKETVQIQPVILYFIYIGITVIKIYFSFTSHTTSQITRAIVEF